MLRPGLSVVLLLVAWLPSVARAEGAVKLLECDVVRVCDARGTCAAGSDSVEFRMEPRELEAGSIGHYTISYGGSQADMQAMSDAGPFIWSVESERHALIASAESEWLWHQLTLSPAPRATIRFLVCSFQQ